MENSLTYCRLCVAQRFLENLVTFDSEAARERKLIIKLKRIGIDVSCDLLPKTVCFDCFEELERTAEFLQKVQLAELTLMKLLNQPSAAVEVKDEKPEIDDSFDDRDYTIAEDMLEKIQPLKLEESYKESKRRKRKKSKPTENTGCLITDIKQEDWNHEGKSWKDYPWKCSKCLGNYDDLNMLRNHSILEHKACCTLKCVDCNAKPFVNHETFAMHVRKHRKYLKYCCLLCNKFFTNSQTLKNHMSDYKKENICRVCGDSFAEKERFEEHIIKFAKSIHFSKRLTPKIHQCEDCFKVFKKACQLTVHKVVHMKNRTRDHSCFLCGKAFYTKGELNVHLDMHENKQRFQCDLCSKTFRLKAKLRQHIIRHSGVKPFSCEYCGKNFRFSWDLKAHIKVFHIQDMKFLCTFCEKKFRTSSGLKIHLRQHTGEKPFGCEQCCHYFTNHSNYYKHMKRRHGMVFPKRRLMTKDLPDAAQSSVNVLDCSSVPKIEANVN